MLKEITQELISRLQNQSSSCQVVIQNDAGKYHIQLRNRSLWEIWTSSVKNKAENDQTITSLTEILGEARIKRIFSRPEYGLKWDAKLIITKEVVQKLWIGLADIRKDDLQECSKDIHALYDSLLPSDNINDIFLGSSFKVDVYDQVASCGKGFKGLMERVWVILNHHKRQNPDRFGEVETLASRLGDREPPVGTILRLDDGYYVLDQIFTGKGAFLSMWKGLSEPSGYFLVGRGTSSRKTSTHGLMSVINDMLPEIGFIGVKAIWPDLQKYLVDNNVKEINLIGKSLGGGHIQYLTPLILGLTNVSVDTVTTYCSVGAPIQKVYDKVIKEINKTEPRVVIIRNAGQQVDYVPCVGGAHLRSKHTFVSYAIPKGEEFKPEFMHNLDNIWKRILGLLQSFGQAHIRQSSLMEYTLLNSEKIAEDIMVGTQLESVRQIIAAVFNVISLGVFRTETFEEFYNMEKMKM